MLSPVVLAVRRLVSSAAVAALAWLVAQASVSVWVPYLGAGALATARCIEPSPLTRTARVIESGRAIEFRHAYERDVPRVPRIPALPLAYGHALWAGLVAAAPGLSWRRRARDLIGGGLAMTAVAWIALVVRLEYAYATIAEPPFSQLIGPVQRAVVYFSHGFCLDIGFFVAPLALTAALHHAGWGTLVLGGRAPDAKKRVIHARRPG